MCKIGKKYGNNREITAYVHASLDKTALLFLSFCDTKRHDKNIEKVAAENLILT